MKLKLIMFLATLVFDFRNYSAKSKCCNNSDAVVVDKMKDEIGHVAVEEFVGLKQKPVLDSSDQF